MLLYSKLTYSINTIPLETYEKVIKPVDTGSQKCAAETLRMQKVIPCRPSGDSIIAQHYLYIAFNILSVGNCLLTAGSKVISIIFPQNASSKLFLVPLHPSFFSGSYNCTM